MICLILFNINDWKDEPIWIEFTKFSWCWQTSPSCFTSTSATKSNTQIRLFLWFKIRFSLFAAQTAMLVCQDLPQMWKKWLSCSDPSRLGICRGCVCRGGQAWIVASRGRRLQWLLATFSATHCIAGAQVKLTFVFLCTGARNSPHTICIEYTQSERVKKKLWWEMKVRLLRCCDSSLQPPSEMVNVYHLTYIRGRTVLTGSLLPVVFLEGIAPFPFPQLSQPAEKTQAKKGGRSALTPDERHASVLD